jgi:predicted ATP-grasp superfamily ATP-dependent carboligase
MIMEDYKMKNVLVVTEANFRTMLSVIRNIKKNEKDIEIIAIAKEDSGGTKSRYISHKIISKENYLETIKNVALENQNIFIFPHLEETYLYLYKEGIDNVIAPPKILANEITNKKEVLSEISKNLPRVIPETIFISEGSISMKMDIIRNFTNEHGKIIVKSTTEIGKTYGPYNRYVVIDNKNINNILGSDIFVYFLENNTSLILQRYIDGFGIGIGGFWLNGKPIAIGGHRRIVQSHGNEGISLIAESYINERALKEAIKIMELFNYSGIGLVEFRLDYNGNVWFMEINPRVWGTLPLYIEAGLDIPYIAYVSYKYGENKNFYPSNFIEGKRMLFLKDYLIHVYIKNKSNLFELTKQLIKIPFMLTKYKEGTFDLMDPFPFIYDNFLLLSKGFNRLFRMSRRS